MTAPATSPTVIFNQPSVKIAAAYGRLYVSGSHAHLLRRLPGATEHERTRSIQLSLTLDSLRAIRSTLGVSKEQMARYCTPEVLRWAKAAGTQERKIHELHQQIANGFRLELPWYDNESEQNGTPYRPAFDHQKVMATVAVALDGTAFICEMGTGKTRAAIESAQAKIERGEIDIVFVVCPKGVMNTWERELKNWSKRLHPVRLRGPVRERRVIVEAHVAGINARGTTFILNYDTLSDMQESIIRLCGAKNVLLILDEMHKVKNPQTQVTQAAIEIARHAAGRIGMTGTPITNGAEDIWSQWYVVDLGITFGANFVQFRREHFVEYAWSWDREPADGALDKIGQKMRLRGLRYRKEDCLDLPPKVYETVEVEMTAEQQRAYNQMRDHLIAWLRGERNDIPNDEEGDAGEPRAATAANQLAAILRLTQITSGFLPTEDGPVHYFEPNPKLQALDEIVRDNVRNGRSVIVWARYRNDITEIMHQFRDLTPVKIDGTQQGRRGEEERNEAERKFQAGETRVLVGNPAAGGVGLNLQRASVAIYYSQGYSLVDRMQSEDRCHRSGSQIHNRVTYIDMVCGGTIDETVREALAGKKEIADVVVDLRRAIGA